MSDAWEEIQAIKCKRNSLRERFEKRRRERLDILSSSPSLDAGDDIVNTSTKDSDEPLKVDRECEFDLLNILSDVSLAIPISTVSLNEILLNKNRKVNVRQVTNLLQKFETQNLINMKSHTMETQQILEVTFVDISKVNAMLALESAHRIGKRKSNDSSNENKIKKEKLKNEDKGDIMSLLAMPSTKEKESKKLGEEILYLLSKPTAKERSLVERFRSQGGKQLMEFCQQGTRIDCERNGIAACKKLHFKKILQKHTDESLGDCSFLNTCFHMDTCKYVHYEVERCIPAENLDSSTAAMLHTRTDDSKDGTNGSIINSGSSSIKISDRTILYPPQWVQCDLRYLDMTVLGKFAVIMADPPWDIHMELPYGTMSDDEMRQLGIPQLQDEGLIFLWVTGRAMELGRECLKLWGYERVDEIIWVKTNQLQRIIRTGRTGHWLNHGKEHCLVGLKGSPKYLNKGLDCDVIVAEVRATSHKPDEIYGMIERLSPGTRKIELFGRPHNIQPNWITLGNQVEGIRLVDKVLIENFKKRYPNGNCMSPSLSNLPTMKLNSLKNSASGLENVK